MPEMSTLSSKSKTPVLPSQGASYARWGRWMDAFSSCLTLKGLHMFATLGSTIPTDFPGVGGGGGAAAASEDAKVTVELVNKLTL